MVEHPWALARDTMVLQYGHIYQLNDHMNIKTMDPHERTVKWCKNENGSTSEQLCNGTECH